MSDLKQARALLEAAERDYSALRGMGDTTVFADEIFGFHAEQAVEKVAQSSAWPDVSGYSRSDPAGGHAERTRRGGGTLR